MGYTREKVAYLRGLADGMELKPEGRDKLMLAMISALEEMATCIDDNSESISEMDESIDDLYDEIDDIDETLDAMLGIDEDDDDDDDDLFDDDNFEEFICPHCGETVVFDQDMIDSNDELICPKCNHTVIEFPPAD